MTQPLPIESIRDVRAHLADVVERADRDDVPTVITRRGKQVAAVVSIEVLRKYQEWEEREIPRDMALRILARLTELESNPFGFNTTALVSQPERRRLRVTAADATPGPTTGS